MTAPAVTYFTIADAGYFLGAAALINSLAATGNDGEVVVVDAGLEDWQRQRLGTAATVVPLDAPTGLAATYYKSYVGGSIEGDVVVYVDSDIIVTGSLERVVSLAASGSVCAAPDGVSGRFFPEWADLLSLGGPVRRQPYMNAGFLATAPSRWPAFYERWRELCEAVIAHAPPMHTISHEEALEHPTGFHDQDALNAMLMSELPPDALAPTGAGEVAATRAELAAVSCFDPTTLECRLDGRRTLFIHHLAAPKPWQRSGWITTSDSAYVQLLSRLLGADDLPVGVTDAELPAWLKGGDGVRRATIVAGIRSVRAASQVFPAPFRRRVRVFLSRR